VCLGNALILRNIKCIATILLPLAARD
jgi:Flp pilus assembly pilin Flp